MEHLHTYQFKVDHTGFHSSWKSGLFTLIYSNVQITGIPSHISHLTHRITVYTKSLYYTRHSIRYIYIHTNLPTCFKIKHRNNRTFLTYKILKKIKRKKKSSFIFSSIPQIWQPLLRATSHFPQRTSRPSIMRTHLPHGILHEMCIRSLAYPSYYPIALPSIYIYQKDLLVRRLGGGSSTQELGNDELTQIPSCHRRSSSSTINIIKQASKQYIHKRA